MPFSRARATASFTYIVRPLTCSSILAQGGKLARSAGTYAQVLGNENDLTMIKLSSGETRYVRSICRATVGKLGNEKHNQLCMPDTNLYHIEKHSNDQHQIEGKLYLYYRSIQDYNNGKKELLDHFLSLLLRLENLFY